MRAYLCLVYHSVWYIMGRVDVFIAFILTLYRAIYFSTFRIGQQKCNLNIFFLFPQYVQHHLILEIIIHLYLFRVYTRNNNTSGFADNRNTQLYSCSSVNHWKVLFNNRGEPLLF